MQLQKILLSVLFAAGALLHAESALLTDNHRPNWVSNCIPNNQKRIPTGAALEWITTGPFACDPEIVKTGSRPSGRNRALLDARRGPEGECQAFGVWGGTKGLWASFIIDLKGVYLIESAAVWARFRRRRSEPEVLKFYSPTIKNSSSVRAPVSSATSSAL